jgi:hypothetical protein
MQLTKIAALNAALFSALYLNPSAAQQAYDTPKFNIGDRWVYKFVDNWNNSETGRRIELATEMLEDGIGISMNNGANWYKGELSKEGLLRKNGGTTTTPHDARAVFPAKDGARAQVEYTVQRSNGASSRAQNDTKFVRFEKINLAAGELETAKFEVAGRWFVGSDSGNFSDQNWYSPAAGRIAKHSHKGYASNSQLRDQTGFELVEFRRCSTQQMVDPLALLGTYKFLIEDDVKPRILKIESPKESSETSRISAVYGIEDGSMNPTKIELIPNSSTVVVSPNSGSRVHVTIQNQGAVCGTFEYPKKGRTVGIAGNKL